MKKHEPSLADRLGASAKARQALLQKARANAPENDPGFAERQEARRIAAEKRAARQAERTATKKADKERKIREQAEAEKARELALIAEQEAAEAAAVELEAQKIALAAAQKAERDRRYAARKARRR